jgi:hypothetical protein
MYKIIGADGLEYGPVDRDTLKAWVVEGRANAQTRIQPVGSTEWIALGQIPEFAEVAASPPAPPPPTLQALPTPASGVRTNPLAVASLVLGLLSLTVFLCCSGLPCNLAGMVCSLIALVQIHNDPARQKGKGLAIAGLVLSLASIALGLLLHLFSMKFGDGHFPGHGWRL